MISLIPSHYSGTTGHVQVEHLHKHICEYQTQYEYQTHIYEYQTQDCFISNLWTMWDRLPSPWQNALSAKKAKK